MLKKLGKKLKKGLKKAAPIIALAGAAALAGRKGRAAKAMQNSMTADMDRSMVPMSNRMVQGLNFPAGTDLSGIDKIAAAGIGALLASTLGIKAMKPGIIAAALLLLKKFWFIIFLPFIWLGKLFTGSSKKNKR